MERTSRRKVFEEAGCGLRRSYFIALVATVLAFGGAYWRFSVETPADYVNRVCRECGVSDADVVELLITFQGATEPRIVLMDLYRDTFDDPSLVGCEECTAAVLDAVGVGVGVD